MSNNKQSSIDYLFERFYANEGMITTKQLEKAKAMHKEEIIKAMSTAFIDGAKIGAIDYESPYENWEQYYKQTFNTKKI